MRVPFFIALRYFFSKSKQTIVNLINLISIGVVLVATASGSRNTVDATQQWLMFIVSMVLIALGAGKGTLGRLEVPLLCR